MSDGRVDSRVRLKVKVVLALFAPRSLKLQTKAGSFVCARIETSTFFVAIYNVCDFCLRGLGLLLQVDVHLGI
jgi:hypothetical protein